MKKRLTLLFASGFGLGYAPIASGTVGSLPGVLLVFVFAPWPVWIQVVAALVLMHLAIPLCSAAEAIYGGKDDGRIVADEYLTFPICLIGIPWTTWPLFLPIAFVVCRIMDILKPSPANQSQSIPGGVGIVLDDVIASLYALGVNTLLWHLMQGRVF